MIVLLLLAILMDPLKIIIMLICATFYVIAQFPPGCLQHFVIGGYA